MKVWLIRDSPLVAVGAPARAEDARAEVSGPLDGLASLTYAEAEGALEDDQVELDADAALHASESSDAGSVRS